MIDEATIRDLPKMRDLCKRHELLDSEYLSHVIALAEALLVERDAALDRTRSDYDLAAWQGYAKDFEAKLVAALEREQVLREAIAAYLALRGEDRHWCPTCDMEFHREGHESHGCKLCFTRAALVASRAAKP